MQNVQGKKAPVKRGRANAKSEKFTASQVDFDITKTEISIEDEQELEAAGQSIMPGIVEQEITISEIASYENEEEVVGMDW